MVDVTAVKNHIISIMKTRGPSLPIQIAKDIKQSSIFASAFLSELLGEKRLKLSNLRVGGTPLYLLDGQEPLLENFKQYLHPKEQEALRLLKDKKILKDSDQDPAIRVALRAIKDFSFSFKMDEQLYWRYLTVSENEVKQILEPEIENKTLQKIELKQEQKQELKQEISQEVKPIIKENITETISKKETIDIKPELMPETKPEIKPELKPDIKEPIKETLRIEKQKLKKINPIQAESIEKPFEPKVSSFDNPLALKPKPEKPEKIKPKSVFVNKVLEFMNNNRFKIILEKDYKAKEYSCITQVETELGPINFLTLAKDKKSVSDVDLDVLLREAQSIPLPALYLAPGELNKRAREYQEKYFSIIKFKKII